MFPHWALRHDKLDRKWRHTHVWSSKTTTKGTRFEVSFRSEYTFLYIIGITMYQYDAYIIIRYILNEYIHIRYKLLNKNITAWHLTGTLQQTPLDHSVLGTGHNLAAAYTYASCILEIGRMRLKHTHTLRRNFARKWRGWIPRDYIMPEKWWFLVDGKDVLFVDNYLLHETIKVPWTLTPLLAHNPWKVDLSPSSHKIIQM